jgi:hypothetical protein
MAQEIIFTIDEKANVEVDLEGFHGKGCDAIAKGFAEALGQPSAVIQHKKEFNAPGLTKNVLQQKR